MEQGKIIVKAENLGFTYVDDDSYELKNVSFPALQSVSFEVREGEYISVLGHNGSGKSTLAKLLNLILTPTEGSLTVAGVDATSPDLTEDEVYEVRKKVGMVFQNPDNQLVATVVEEDVAFGPENLGLEREEIRRRVKDALNMVNMQEYARHAPHKLSGGQKQRIAIAGIIAMKPRMIIFDESTAMLDPLGRNDVIEIMERLNKDEGITVINITHYMDEAARADRVLVINDGRLVLDGMPADVLCRVEELHSMGLESPQGTELLHALRKEGFNIPGVGLSETECIDSLTSFLNEIGKQ